MSSPTAPEVGRLYRTNTLIPEEYGESVAPGVVVEVLANRSYGGSDVRVVQRDKSSSVLGATSFLRAAERAIPANRV